MNVPTKKSDYFYAYQLVNLDTRVFYEFHGDLSAFGRISAEAAVGAEVIRMIKAVTKQTGQRIISLGQIVPSEVFYNVQFPGGSL